MATSRSKRRRNLWPFDSFTKSTVYHLRGRQRGVKESSTSRYKGYAIYRRAEGYTVPALDRESIFDDKREAKRFIDAMSKANPKRTMTVYDLYWSPTGQKIATVEASTKRAAIRKAPKPYSKYKGEIYAEDRGAVSNPRRERNASSWIVYPSQGSPRSFGFLASAKKWAKVKANESGVSSIIYPSDGKGKTHHVYPDKKRNPTLSLPRNKFVTAKVRMKGGKIQVLVDESVLGHAGASGHVSLNRKRKRNRRRKR